MVWWTKSNFLGLYTLLQVSPSNVQNITPNPLKKKGTDARVDIWNFTVVREVQRNIYQSHNLIGPYHFWGKSPRNLTWFTRVFLAGRRARVGHKTKLVSQVVSIFIGCKQSEATVLCLWHHTTDTCKWDIVTLNIWSINYHFLGPVTLFSMLN